jgi:hypothetical protein
VEVGTNPSTNPDKLIWDDARWKLAKGFYLSLQVVEVIFVKERDGD